MDIKKIINIHANMKVYRKMTKASPGSVNTDIMNAYKSLIFFGELLDFYDFYKGRKIPNAAIKVLLGGILPDLPSPLNNPKDFNNIRHANKYTYKTGPTSLNKYSEALRDITTFIPNIIIVIDKLDSPLKRISKIQTIKGRKSNPEFAALSTGMINNTINNNIIPAIKSIVKGRMLELKPDYAQGPADHFPLTVAGLREYLGKPGGTGFRDIKESLFYQIFSLEVNKKLTRIVPAVPAKPKKFMNESNKRLQFYYVPGDIRAIVDDCLIRGELAILKAPYGDKSNFYRAYLARYHAYTHEMKELPINNLPNRTDIALGLPDTVTYKTIKEYITACCVRLESFKLGNGPGIETLELDNRLYDKYWWNGFIYERCAPEHIALEGRPWVTMTIHLGETKPTILPTKVNRPARLTGSAGGYHMYDLITKKITAKNGKQESNTKTAAIQFCKRDLTPVFISYYVNQSEAKNSVFRGEYITMKSSINEMLTKSTQLIRKNTPDPPPNKEVQELINGEFLKLLTKGGTANES